MHLVLASLPRPPAEPVLISRRIITGLDPGPSESALVTLCGSLVLRARYLPNEDIREGELDPDALLAIEEVQSYGTVVGKSVFDTCVEIGRFVEAHSGEYTLISKPNWKLEVTHHPRSKNKHVRQALIDRWGGEEVAIGGAKCPKCKGKGWFGRGRPTCARCGGSRWEHAPGQLYHITGHMWDALGVAVAAQILLERSEM